MAAGISAARTADWPGLAEALPPERCSRFSVRCAPGDCRAPPGLATVFAVFTLNPGSYRIGGMIDWFSFERA